MEAALQALIAAAASFTIVSIIVSFIVLLLCRRRRRKQPTSSVAPAAAAANESFYFDPSLRHVSLPELAAATRGFAADAIVGDGGFGFVYKARLESGATVAVKRLSSDAFTGLREFRAEMETLGKIRHPNLARLLGYCVSGDDRLLVYEFLDRGSLDTWLHGDPPAAALTWTARMGIVRGVAAGLCFLHEECRPRVIHRDIKSSNVLLDEDFGARIADFGLARRVDSARSHVSTQVAGTAGYMAPEYGGGAAAAATAAADVYSFGILMMEMATGRRPSWPVKEEGGGEMMGLVGWAKMKVRDGMAWQILDPRIEKDGVDRAEVEGFLGLACRCTDDQARKRPTMSEAVEVLRQLDRSPPPPVDDELRIDTH